MNTNSWPTPLNYRDNPWPATLNYNDTDIASNEAVIIVRLCEIALGLTGRERSGADRPPHGPTMAAALSLIRERADILAWNLDRIHEQAKLRE